MMKVKVTKLEHVVEYIRCHRVNDEFLVHIDQQEPNEVYNVQVKAEIQHHLIYSRRMIFKNF